jgi:dynein heavy chain
LYKLQKLFESRIKAQKEREAKEKHIPISLLYDEDNLTEVPPSLKICNTALESLKLFKTYLPTIEILCNPAMKPRHWEQMSEICGFDVTPNAGTSLRKLLGMGLEPYMSDFEGISSGASKEYALEKSVDKMKSEWDKTQLNTIPYK